MTETPVILDAHGQPARATAKKGPRRCPRCRGEKFVASAGFGEPHPVCARCGYEYHGERMEGES